MSRILLQVCREIVEKADFDAVMVFDTIIQFPKLEQSFEPACPQAAFGTLPGAIVHAPTLPIALDKR